MAKNNLKKVAASRKVSWEFSVISEDNSTSKWVLRSFIGVYIPAPKIFTIILSPLFVSQEVVLLAFIS